MSCVLEPTVEVVEGIVHKLKTNGMFDEMRRDCLADIDTKPAFQNLKQRVENYVNALLSSETWSPSLNKNQLRSKVRASVMSSGMLNTGIEHILHQVVDAKMYTEFLPKITDYISENNEALYKEFAPKPEVEEEPETEQTEEMDLEPEEPKDESSQAAPPPSEPENDVTSEGTSKETEEADNVPAIPEGAASTLRTLIQSLLTTDIQSFLKTDDVDKKVEETDGKTEIKRQNSSGNSPSIDPSQIEAFTDEEDDPQSKEASPGRVGPCTPDELCSNSPQSPEDASANISMKSNDNLNESESSSANESEEDLAKVDSDASFHSGADGVGGSDSDVVVDEGSVGEEAGGISAAFESEEINIVDVNSSLIETIDQDEIVEYTTSEAIVEGECVVLEDNSQSIQDIALEAEVVDEEEIQIQHQIHSREKKRRHKKHRRRRHSTTEEESDGSARVSTASGSSDELEGEEVEVVKKSRKKKKKKRSKKHKKLKSKTRDLSQEKVQWESSSEYRSLSPSHPEYNQRRTFIPSPLPPNSVRFEEDNRAVKVEPAFMSQMPPRFRDPYAVDRDMEGPRPPMGDVDHPFPGHRDDDMMRFSMRPGFPLRSPPHFPPHVHPRFSPPRFSGPPRFSASFSRAPSYHGHPSSPPPRRYSPTFEFFRPPMHPGFDLGPPRSPPHGRRFSPPRQMGRFPGGMPPRPFPGPPDERFMPHPGGPRPMPIPPGPMMRPDMLPGHPMDMRRPPMR